MTKKEKQIIVEGSFIQHGDGKLVEITYQPDRDPSKQFVIYNPKRDELDYSSEIRLTDNKKLIPLQTIMIDKDVVLLPSNEESYGSEKELLSEIQSFIYKYLDVSSFFRRVSAYYVLLSWVYDRFSVVPYLRVIGDPGTGKSRFLQTVGLILYKPMFASGATTASPIFRLIEKVGGSLIIDEADFRNSEMWSDIIKILNCGYQKGMPVLRTEGEKNRDVRAYAVYSPKILATRKRFKDLALESRMITYEMNGSPRPDIPLVLPQEAWDEALVLRNKLLMWRFRNYNDVSLPKKDDLGKLEPRLKQILLPLTGIIKDKKSLEELKDFARSYQEQIISDRGLERHVEVLEAMVSLKREDKDLTMKHIADKLNESVDSDSGEKKITPHRVGYINRNYLRLHTRRTGGRYQIIWEAKKMRLLCSRYGIKFPYEEKGEEDIVTAAEEIFGVKAQDSQNESPESTKSPSEEAEQGTLGT